MGKDKVDARRKHLEKQLGPETASRISRVDYIRILRAERDGRVVQITKTSGGRMVITSSPPELVPTGPRRPTVRSTAAIMRLVGPTGPVATGVGARKADRIVPPPGHHSLQVLQFLFSQKTYDRLFAQIAADEREEHAEALSKGQLRKAEWIEIRVNLLLVWSAAIWMLAVVGKQFWSIWKLGSSVPTDRS